MQNFSYEELRSMVLEALPSVSPDTSQYNNLQREVARIANRLTQSNAPLADAGKAKVWSIFWDLLIEGVVRPGLNQGDLNQNLPFFHVTEFGKKVIKDGPNTPYDPDGYTARLQKQISNLDPVILTYLNESLHTFRIGCLLSSTVTLGCASEKALLLLIDAYAAKLPKASCDKFVNETTGRMIKTQYDTFQKQIDGRLRGALKGSDLEQDLDNHLSGIFNLIRNSRNEAGHPTGRVIERESAYANLLLFPVYLRHVYGLIDWLATATLV